MTPQEVLALKMPRNDAKAKTVKDYLIALLLNLWGKGESFSGKRPFGNSGWEYDLYNALVKGKAINGKTIGGFAEDFDEDAARGLIAQAIKALQ